MFKFILRLLLGVIIGCVIVSNIDGKFGGETICYDEIINIIDDIIRIIMSIFNK